MIKVAFGGGCHWCTEAIFQSLIGVKKVEQGYVSIKTDTSAFSEAVIVHYNPNKISLRILIEIHLLTHNSSSNHSMRSKYRSAVYGYSDKQINDIQFLLEEFQKETPTKIITKALYFGIFKASREEIQNYYQKDPEKPFCKTYINPKLSLLMSQFSKYIAKK